MQKAIAVLPLLFLLSLVARPEPPLFAGPDDDGRVGTVRDVSGVAIVSPAGHDRWTPLSGRSILMAGDRVRTLTRGPNALELDLRSGGSLVLGPGTLVELSGPTAVRILRGGMEATGVTGAAIAVTGPGGRTVDAGAEPAWFRAGDSSFDVLDGPPRWLVGYRESATTEWMGALVADVDGRNVPLNIGFHKVSVVIRDQVAETTIDESFVNTTDGTLEGTFTFPLPADASIGGFGMWVGDELVMADVVERGRAREIYEDILRRRKDPGLLEWSGGNLFKARVFPIFPHSEKRIRIRYTQVLPLEGDTLRYRYHLRSDLLRSHPLKSLSIRASVASARPLDSVATPSHETTIRKTDHEVLVDYDARDVVPERDFELTMKLGAVKPLTVIPHRRGNDGYFLLLLSPPDAASAGLTRELAPEGDPVDVVLLADTSGSMGPAEREAQAAFLESLLSLLGPEDTFRLGAVDVGVAWFRPGAVAATPENAAAALAFLAARVSLGWSDLERGLAEATAVAGPGSHVVYLGDGIGTAGDPDAAARARRIEGMAGGTPVTFHAVATGSSYEKGVLEAIAAIGGGSVRDGSVDPADAAFDLLAEIARPVVKDLAVTFTGVRTARVYPRRLPNLAAGRQQIVLGRFDPVAGGADGTVVVTGRLEGKEVRYSAPFRLAADEEGNSFLPRLWARRHVDALLAEKLTPPLREEVVAFSAEFGILTPLTSFLVLESDEDRRRYGVERRVSMSDGERFFAAAKDRVDTEILRQAMREAGSWRQHLRARVLAEIEDLGRSLPIGNSPYFFGGGVSAGAHLRNELGDASREREESEKLAREDLPLGKGEGADVDAVDGPADELPSAEPTSPGLEPATDPGGWPGTPPPPGPSPVGASSKSLEDARGYFPGGAKAAPSPGAELGLRDMVTSRSGDRPVNRYDQAVAAVLGLFPFLPPVPADPKVEPAKWPAEVEEILAGLDWTPELRACETGLTISSSWSSYHPLRSDATTSGRSTTLLAPGVYLAWTENRGASPVLSLCDATARRVLNTDTRLGRKRPAGEGEATALRSLNYAPGYRGWEAKLESRDGAKATLRFTAPTGDREMVLVVDTERRVPLERRILDAGETTATTRWTDWTTVAGLPFPGDVTNLDATFRTTWHSTTEAQVIDDAGALFARRVERTSDGLFLGATEPELLAAKERAAAGEATFADRLVLALDHAGRQQWDEALAEWEKARTLVPGKPGADWLEAALLVFARRGEAAKESLFTLAGAVEGRPVAEAVSLAGILESFAHEVLGPNERISLIERLLGVVPGTGDDAARWRESTGRRLAGLLERVRRQEDALAIRRALRAADPNDPRLALELATALANLSRPEEAMDVLRDAIAREETAGRRLYTDGESDSLHQRLVDLIWNTRDLEAFLAAVDRWLARNPAREDAWERRHTALVLLGRIEELDREVLTFLATMPGEAAAPADVARLGAAIDHALGQAWNYRASRLLERWWKPLGDAALRLARRDDAAGELALRILGNGGFRQTDEYRRVMAGLRRDLLDADLLAGMVPRRIGRLCRLFSFRRDQATDEEYAVVTKALRARYESMENGTDRWGIASYLLGIQDERGDAKAAADFLRRRIGIEPHDEQGFALVRELLVRLLRMEWSPAVEDEIFAIVPDTVPPGDRNDAYGTWFGNQARRIADGLFSMRLAAGLGDPAANAKLPRAELRAKRATARQQVRAALAVRFEAEAAKADAVLRPWYAIEGLCFAAEADPAPAAVEARAREMLLSSPAVADPDLDFVLDERLSLVLDFLCLRRDAPEGIAARTLELRRERLGQATEDERDERRYRLFRLLLALDRPDELEATIREWIAPDGIESGYRIALARLLAERGKLGAAAAELEAVAAKDELSASDYEVLADWYLALGEDARREKARDRRYGAMTEYDLGQLVWSEYSRVANPGPDGVPPDLDAEVIRVERILMSKASRPQGYLYQVFQLYRQTKDFRLLAALADGVVGHSPEAVYPYLTQCQGQIGDVHEEATLEEIARRIGARAEAAEAATDRRGLLYLTALVERRAAEVLNRPERHSERAVPALRAAFPDEWRPGEPRYLAEFLASLGRIPVPSLADEQIRQLAAIHATFAAPTPDGLAIASAYARTLWFYSRWDEAIDVLSAAVEAMRPGPGKPLAASGYAAAFTLVSWWEHRERFRRAEDWLAAEREMQPSEGHRATLTLRIFALWRNALASRGAVSLGEGEAIWTKGLAAMTRALFSLPADRVDEVVNAVTELARAAAHNARIEGVPAKLAAFARGPLREAFARVPESEPSLWRTVASAVENTGDRTLASTLLVEKLESDPDWYDRVGRDGWPTFDSSLAEWRARGAVKGPLAGRLRAIVLDRLERGLVTGAYLGNSFWQRHDRWFWDELAEDFATVARKVIELRGDDAAVVVRAASYLWSGLDLHAEAADVLLDLDARQGLDDEVRLYLARWLQELGRHREAVVHLKKLLDANPDRLDVRVELVESLHATGDDEAGKALVDGTEERFRAQERWDAGAFTALADACYRAGYWSRAAKYLEAVIRFYEPWVTSGRYVPVAFGESYARLAECLVKLGREDEAVRAASAAVVVWGRDVHRRGEALSRLQVVIAGLPDLDAWVAKFDAEVAATGLDAPVIRKAVGAVYLRRREWEKAAAQLRIARELSPVDREVHEMLVRALDGAGDGAGALAALVDSLRYSPSDLDLMARLAERFDRAGQPEQARRALTNLVEADPLEAAGHSRLADRREQEKDFEAAIVQRRIARDLRAFDPEPWFALVRTLRAAGRAGEARDVLLEMIRRSWSPPAGDVGTRAKQMLK